MIFIKYVVLDAWAGGDDYGVSGNGIIEKDYTLLISNYIYNKLKEKGINVILTRDDDYNLNIDERVEIIQNQCGTSSGVVVVSNQLNHDNTNGIEIIYALRNSSALAEKMADFLGDAGFEVTDFYQKRNPSNSANDFDEIIDLTNNNETIIVRYGNVNNLVDVNNIENNWQEMAEAIVKALTIYVGGEYVDEGYYTVQSGDRIFMGNNE